MVRQVVDAATETFFLNVGATSPPISDGVTPRRSGVRLGSRLKGDRSRLAAADALLLLIL